MSASEMYDFLDVAVADYDYTLTLRAQGTVTEEGFKNQVIHIADDGSEERITLSTGSIFYVSWSLPLLTEANVGTLVDLYHDAAKANGIANSFKWAAYDGHTYVVRFDCNLDREIRRAQWGISQIRFRVLGKIADA